MTSTPSHLHFRPAISADTNGIWDILEPIFRAADTYAIDPNISKTDAIKFWTSGNHSAFVILDGSQILGTYYICPNQGGGGAHVCNCGFATSPEASGKGVARTMLAHSETTAREMGYKAMQFNFVVTSNTRAISIWQRHGFDTVGRLPGAFLHPKQGYVDALVMYKSLNETKSDQNP